MPLGLVSYGSSDEEEDISDQDEKVEPSKPKVTIQGEISDDEDDTHPNIHTPSLFKWRHDVSF